MTSNRWWHLPSSVPTECHSTGSEGGDRGQGMSTRLPDSITSYTWLMKIIWMLWRDFRDDGMTSEALAPTDWCKWRGWGGGGGGGGEAAIRYNYCMTTPKKAAPGQKSARAKERQGKGAGPAALPEVIESVWMLLTTDWCFVTLHRLFASRNPRETVETSEGISDEIQSNRLQSISAIEVASNLLTIMKLILSKYRIYTAIH